MDQWTTDQRTDRPTDRPSYTLIEMQWHILKMKEEVKQLIIYVHTDQKGPVSEGWICW